MNAETSAPPDAPLLVGAWLHGFAHSCLAAGRVPGQAELMNSSAREVIALVAEKAPPSVADLAAQIREQNDALDELVMAAELSSVYRDDRAFGRLREALTAWREASGDPR